MQNTFSLKKNSEFARMYKRGKFFAGKFLVIYVLNNNMNINRLGITVSKKNGKSVRRNRIRRLIRENYRLYESYIKKGNDIIFVARAQELIPDFLEVKKEMRFLFKKIGIFDLEKWQCQEC
ncbi:MAG TPA: ribonuclease P protein component [Clostridia bacterium]